ncbi:ABC transporter substrate-binding protein [Ensifer sp.]|jgi:ABC-type Fe3+ transport system substrate-binding protein|uniref:ABC transporter substrate-binding protein n=1 Tax=Ensifer sp. TaxID=1872086 RepID=UPI002E11EFE6|nr:substrate-binding domain-containing protein [Ensifer sp.]
MIARFALALLTAVTVGSALAHAAPERLTIVGVDARPTVEPLLEALEADMPHTQAEYSEARPSQIISRLLAGVDGAEPIDVLILPTPDLAVYLANEGSASRYPASAIKHRPREHAHWRGEVFSIGYDPAVFVVRKGAIAPIDVPRTRTGLARTLEQNRTRLLRRVGLVNIGIDNVSYAFASQEALRSPLFWRISRAVGAAQARIFDSNEELLQALSQGRVDLAYNVPLSAARKWASENPSIEIVIPEDYVLALPWTALIPEKARNRPTAGDVVDFLLSERAKSALEKVGLTRSQDLATMKNVQFIELGPELLVYLDAVKRSRFLDTWFQLVIQD